MTPPFVATKLQTVATKPDLMDWVVEALRHLGGRAGVVQVSKQVWNTHAADLAASEDLFYTWQYDIRWAARSFAMTAS